MSARLVSHAVWDPVVCWFHWINYTCVLALLIAQAVTGLVLAGTDLFYPPFGRWFADAFTPPFAWRRPFAEFHEISFYVLLAMAVLHIAAVVMTDLRGHGALISAMFSGRKIVDLRQAKPMDPARDQP